MSEFDLNLSTRPFPAYGVINLALIGVLVVLVVLSGWQVYGFAKYTELSKDIRDEEQNLRVDTEALGRRLAAAEAILNRPVAAAKLSEIGFLNSLIIRKRFSWTRVFGTLEDLVPDTVHLVNLTPEFQPNGSVLMRLNVRGRSHEEIRRLIDTLEGSSEFENVIVSTEQKPDASPSSDIDIAMSVNYYPDGDTAGRPATMKSVYKRQRQQFVFAAGLGVIALINLLFFFILYRPTKNQYFNLQSSIDHLRGEMQAQREQVDRLERLGIQLETSEQDRQSLYLSRFNQRSVGYSKVLPELQNLAIMSGVRKNHVDYELATIPQYGLYSVKIRFAVQGGYANVVRFIQELERAETFFIIEGIDVQGAAESATSSVAANTGVSLTLALETFFYQ